MNKSLLITFYILIYWPPISLALQTNINEVTDLFDRHIEDKNELLQGLETQNSNAINQIKSAEYYDAIEGMVDAGAKIDELNNIEETDLGNAGRVKRSSREYQFYDENELEPDYTKPGNRLHKQDSEDIVSATDVAMKKIGSDFMAKLNSEGFDCKTVKGPVQKEPTYYIEIKRDTQKNTEYDQFFCEEPRNNYNCTDSVSLTCKRRGKGYGEWEPRTIRFNGHVLHNTKMDWGFAIKWKYKRWGWHISPNHPSSKAFSGPEAQVDSKWRKNPAAIIADARAYIALQLGVSIEQIGEHVQFPASGRGIGNIGGVGCRWRVVWDEYEFGYSYRDAYDTCEEWEEDWTERCALK